MESDTLFRTLFGYSLAVFSAAFFLIVIGRIIWVFLQNVYHASISFIGVMKKVPYFLKSSWPKIKDSIIILCGICLYTALIVMAFHDCYGHSNNNYHNSEEYEDALRDKKWNVPSRYRD